MSRRLIQTIIGLSVVVVHIFSFAMIMFFKSEWMSMTQRIDVALVLLPVTSTYFMAVVKTAVDDKEKFDDSPRVNLNYILVVFLVTGSFLAAVAAIVVEMPGPMAPTIEDAKNWLIGLQVGLGGAFGYIASDLFGKLERTNLNNVNQ
ncbi:hypothetical protein [Methylobacterium radiotolerans]|uniref:hypothetical protein n=1 Tax=Methylobacterium radiotolerans TaxID=31998 RepID=UPI0010579DDF|nr:MULTISPECIES: hypothetical protein [Methylobacterium]MDE3747367.1 hypothetical protein [Methylobacterium radiotolerans]